MKHAETYRKSNITKALAAASLILAMAGCQPEAPQEAEAPTPTYTISKEPLYRPPEAGMIQRKGQNVVLKGCVEYPGSHAAYELAIKIENNPGEHTKLPALLGKTAGKNSRVAVNLGFDFSNVKLEGKGPEFVFTDELKQDPNVACNYRLPNSLGSLDGQFYATVVGASGELVALDGPYNPTTQPVGEYICDSGYQSQVDSDKVCVRRMGLSAG